MNEFQLIHHYFSRLTASHTGVSLGIGDDCALLDVPAGYELAVTTDTLVAGRHFPLDTAAEDIGWKSLAVNLSDLAAMGAEPRWFTLALTLPEADEAWLKKFSEGLKQLADLHQVALVGGDTTRGPLSITLTAMGLVPAGQALRRSGAQAGDLIAVTGNLGDAALALQNLLSYRRTPVSSSSEIAPGQRLDSGFRRNDEAFLLSRLNRPTPRIAAGLALRGLAHAAIDLSDGLAGDLNHILKASGLGAVIEADLLPMSEPFKYLAIHTDRLALQAQGGDDYELCLCLSPAVLDAVRARLDIPLTVIGRLSAEPGLLFVDQQGSLIALAASGYQHF